MLVDLISYNYFWPFIYIEVLRVDGTMVGTSRATKSIGVPEGAVTIGYDAEAEYSRYVDTRTKAMGTALERVRDTILVKYPRRHKVHEGTYGADGGGKK